MTVSESLGNSAGSAPCDFGHELYAVQVLASVLIDPDRPVAFWRDGCLRAGQMAEQMLDATAALHRLGVGDGTTVAVLMEGNRPELLVARYATHLLGACVVHIRSMNPRTDSESFSAQTQTALLRETGATVLVVDDEHVERARRLRAGCDEELALVTAGPARDGVTSLAQPREQEPLPVRTRPNSRAAVTFTSGSTGAPKALGLSFAVWNRLVRLLAGDRSAPTLTPTRMLAVTPMSHAVAPMLDAALATGGSVVLHEEFDPKAVLSCIEWLRVTDTYLAVPHLYQLLDHPALSGTDVSSLRRIVYSGTPAAPLRVAAAVRAFGPSLVQVYGASETGGISCLTPEDHLEPELLGTVGRPFPWVRVQIREPVTHSELPRGEVGEVCVLSPTAMMGYLSEPDSSEPDSSEPDSTSQKLAEGWLGTGDLGKIDRHGYLVLAGRRHFVIKSGGLKVYPDLVERTLVQHPDVADAVVYGWRDADDVEHVHAAVQRRSGATCAGEALRAYVATALSPSHTPVRLTFWDALPVTAQGKPDRQYLASTSEREGATSHERNSG